MNVSVSAIERTLIRIPTSKYDEEYFDMRMAKSDHPDCVAYVIDKSDILTQLIKTQSETLGLVKDISKWLDKYPLLLIPRQAFVAEAVHDCREEFIVISEGCHSLIRLTAEFNLLRMIVNQRQQLDNLTNDERTTQTSEINQMFLRVFASQLSAKHAVPLPTVIAEDSPRLILGSRMAISALVETFVVMHEVGHLNLYHLRSKWWQIFGTKIIRDELLLPEDMNVSKSQELEADTFAIQHAEGNGRQLLLLGAELYFLCISLLQSARGHHSKFHPHAGNRLQSLFAQFSTSSNKDVDSTTLIHEMDEAWNSRNVGFNGGRFLNQYLDLIRGNTDITASESMLAVAFYTKVAKKFFSDIDVRPDAYKRVLQPFT